MSSVSSVSSLLGSQRQQPNTKEDLEEIEKIARTFVNGDQANGAADAWENISKKKRKRLFRKAENVYRGRGLKKNVKRKRSNLRESKKTRRSRESVDIATCEFICSSTMRAVIPYVHEFSTYTKERWIGRGLFDVYSSEFSAHPSSYYRQAISQGMITVNGEKCSGINHLLKNGDKIIHRTHRHEPPVICGPLKICHQSDDVLVIDKPSTIPVHPCGAYYHNSLTHILRKEHPDLWPVHIVHRLDRLTSGLVLLARNRDFARKVCLEIEKKTVQKTYLALVRGKFPTDLDAMVAHIDVKNLELHGGTVKVVPGEHGEKFIEVSVPQRCLDPKNGVYECHAEGKSATTLIKCIGHKRIGANRKGSVVVCMPRTGRTHQIRLHLQFLGFPIGNDPNYGPPETNVETIASKSEVFRPLPATAAPDTDLGRLKALCSYCNGGSSATFTNTQLRHTGIWLHALKYKGSDWEYQVGRPEWAGGLQENRVVS